MMMVRQRVPKFMLRQLQLFAALPPLKSHRAHKIRGNITAIVAVKPTNKAGPPAAEPVERRAGTEGNAAQQSTHRTQSRARVTQELGRVRQAARQRKTEQFTALLHHITVDTLRTAYYALRRKAAPGVDGMTWEDYEGDLEPRLEDLHDRVHRGAYRPNHPAGRI